MTLPAYVVALDAIAQLTAMALQYLPADGLPGAALVAICMFVTLWATWHRLAKV